MVPSKTAAIKAFRVASSRKGGNTLYLESKPINISSFKTKLCTATLQVTCNPLAFASFINLILPCVEIVGICIFPPVYSSKNKLRATCNSSASAGIPFKPNFVLTSPSFAIPLPFNVLS